METDDKNELEQRAKSLRARAEMERCVPLMLSTARRHYEEAVEIYRKLDMPLTLAHTIRHLGLVHEDAGHLNEAEKYYDEALALYREHAKEDDLNYANAVRYPAVIKERLGNKEESAKLWEEAHDRYAAVGPNGLGEGVAEAAAWLTIFAVESGDRQLADKWLARASAASAASGDPDTHRFIATVRKRFEEKFNG